jgi:hypothetical protein
MTPVTKCPLEQQLETALTDAGIKFLRENENPLALDFYLPEYDLYLEVKSGFTPRAAKQMERASNVIVVQGMRSTSFIAMLLTGNRK